jgi:hypothetical protein
MLPENAGTSGMTTTTYKGQVKECGCLMRSGQRYLELLSVFGGGDDALDESLRNEVLHRAFALLRVGNTIVVSAHWEGLVVLRLTRIDSL